jgi:hypothetical protein
LKFWYDRQQEGDTIAFEFRCFRGPGGDAVPVGEAAKTKRPTSGKRIKKGKQPARGTNDPEGSNEDEDSTRSSDSSSDTDGEDKGDDNEDDADDGNEEVGEVIQVPTKGRKGVKKVLNLPFAAIPAKRNQGAPPPKRKGRYAPSTGPQFEKPLTRRRGHIGTEEDQEEGPSRKKRKIDVAVEKVGPPIGIPKDKPQAGTSGKGGRGKGKGRAKKV